MAKGLSIISRLMFLFFAFCMANVSHANGMREVSELVVLTWPDYIDPTVVSAFERSHDTKIHFVHFKSDDERDRLILDTNGHGFDVVLLSGMPIGNYVNHAWLTPLDEKNIPNIRHIDQKWRKIFADAARYSVPFFWGTVGVAYRSDLVNEPITSWRQFFNPPADTGKTIVMTNASREAIGMALKADGYSVNTTNLTQIKAAGALLKKQQPFVQTYHYLDLNENAALVTGRATMALAYNGDAITLKEYHPNIEFVIPQEGTLLWVDHLAVMASSNKKKLAFDFINFLNEPDNASALAIHANYATPNLAAEEKLPAAFRNNKTIYPDKATIEKSEIEKALTPKAAKEFALIMSRLTRN